MLSHQATTHILISSMIVFASINFASGDEDARNRFFEARIRPVLIKHCFPCHSEKSDELQADLRLDRQLTKDTSLIVAGNPDKSPLIDAIRYTNSDLQMPPDRRLPAQVIDDFETWVKQGAFDPRPPLNETPTTTPANNIDLDQGRQFWAFRPIRQEPPPPILEEDRLWASSAIDAFILEKLKSVGLKPADRADKRTLVRRASFVLIGLPPTPDQVEQFVNDQSPDAFARLVDRLLASPEYGARWGRHWLDVVRYGDCNGADESRPFPNAWHFRNYIVETFNRDLPYDRMIAEHLAGDLLEHDGEGEYEPLVGTGFLVLGTKILAEQDQKKMQADIIDEQIDAFSRAMLAITMACARCHDHKFDPIPTTDYYALAGIFQSTKTMQGYGKWMVRPAHTRQSLIDSVELKPLFESKQQELKDFEQEIAQIVDKVTSSDRVIQFEAEKFARGDVTIETTNYGKGIGIVGDRGDGKLAFAEYDIEIKTPRQYLLQIRYAAAASRPGKISLNGKVVIEPALKNITGNWHPQGQRWHTEGVLELKPGVQKLRFESAPTMVHVDKLRLAQLEQGSKLSEAMKTKATLKAEVDALSKRVNPPLTVMAVTEGKTIDAKVNLRGSHLKLGQQVPRRFLQVVAGSNQAPLPKEQSGRLQLARWMANPDHPLTSRVMVNRLWRWHFGRGIVATPDNFGQQGERPTHPELLDFLARRFIELNWSIKAMHREIMLSSTWQMSSTGKAENAKTIDPENRLYWKVSRRRLEAEAIRDALLAISGRLDSSVGGAPLKLKTIALSPGQLKSQQKIYDESNRRTIYLPVLRTNVYDFLTLFDFANPDLPTGSRVTTTVPTQALLMMNSPLVQDCANRVAELSQNQANSTDAQRITELYLRLLARKPTTRETQLATNFINAYSKLVNTKAEPPQLSAWAAFCKTLIASNEFVYLR